MKRNEGKHMVMEAYWEAVAKQDAGALRTYFCPDARIRWYNTDEEFTVEEFLRANCEYPNEWKGQVERQGRMGETEVTVTRVWTEDGTLSFHVTSFFEMEGDRIKSLDEYWGDDGAAPQWRREMNIGRRIGVSNPSPSKI